MNRFWLLVLCSLIAACSGQEGTVTSALSSTSTTQLLVTTSISTPTTSVATTATLASGTTTTTADGSTATEPPPIGRVTASRLGHSWQEGCPVGVEELRLLRVGYIDFDAVERTGELVIHKDFAESVLQAFEAMLAAGYPIESVIPIGDLPEDAEDEPDYNNTSAFHCRFVEGTTRWSRHAYGGAIDINPFQNPFVRGDEIWPTGAGRFVDRSVEHPAMIRAGDTVVTAFEAIGWPWGGYWSSLKDYQHFSDTGT